MDDFMVMADLANAAKIKRQYEPIDREGQVLRGVWESRNRWAEYLKSVAIDIEPSPPMRPIQPMKRDYSNMVGYALMAIPFGLIFAAVVSGL